MLPPELVPERIRDAVGRRYQYDNSTFKVNWALRAPIPWSAADARRASTVNVAEGMDGLTRATTQLAASEIPERPFLVLGQYSMVDSVALARGHRDRLGLHPRAAGARAGTRPGS